jgi:Flp pilus assembly protein TadD
LVQTGTLVGISLGIGVLILPIIGAVLLVFELRFGAATARLARQLADDGELPDDSALARRPSGRIERASADAYFETVKTKVEADEGNWRLWYELGYAYNLAGDRKRARAAMRHAIELADA